MSNFLWNGVLLSLTAAFVTLGCSSGGKFSGPLGNMASLAGTCLKSSEGLCKNHGLETRSADADAGHPTVSFELETHTLGLMSFNNLLIFLSRVADDAAVTVEGNNAIADVHTKIVAATSKFTAVQAKFASVSALFNDCGLDVSTQPAPETLKSNLIATANYLAQGIPPTNQSTDTVRSSATSCLGAASAMLNECTNGQNQASCNDLAASFLCAIDYETYEANAKPESDANGGDGTGN